MNKKKVSEATLEEILADICNWEDMDSALIISTTQDGGVFVMDYEGRLNATGPTARGAMIEYQRAVLDRYPWMREPEELERYALDWTEEMDGV